MKKGALKGAGMFRMLFRRHGTVYTLVRIRASFYERRRLAKLMAQLERKDL